MLNAYTSKLTISKLFGKIELPENTIKELNLAKNDSIAKCDNVPTPSPAILVTSKSTEAVYQVAKQESDRLAKVGLLEALKMEILQSDENKISMGTVTNSQQKQNSNFTITPNFDGVSTPIASTVAVRKELMPPNVSKKVQEYFADKEHLQATLDTKLMDFEVNSSHLLNEKTHSECFIDGAIFFQVKSEAAGSHLNNSTITASTNLSEATNAGNETSAVADKNWIQTVENEESAANSEQIQQQNNDTMKVQPPSEKDMVFQTFLRDYDEEKLPQGCEKMLLFDGSSRSEAAEEKPRLKPRQINLFYPDSMWPPHFHPHNQEWRVRYRFKGAMRVKAISCKQHGLEGGKQLALAFVARWVKSGRPLASKTQRSKLSVLEISDLKQKERKIARKIKKALKNKNKPKMSEKAKQVSKGDATFVKGALSYAKVYVEPCSQANPQPCGFINLDSPLKVANRESSDMETYHPPTKASLQALNRRFEAVTSVKNGRVAASNVGNHLKEEAVQTCAAAQSSKEPWTDCEQSMDWKDSAKHPNNGEQMSPAKCPLSLLTDTTFQAYNAATKHSQPKHRDSHHFATKTMLPAMLPHQQCKSLDMSKCWIKDDLDFFIPRKKVDTENPLFEESMLSESLRGSMDIFSDAYRCVEMPFPQNDASRQPLNYFLVFDTSVPTKEELLLTHQP